MLTLLLLAASSARCTIPLEPTRTAFVTTVTIGESRPLRFLVDTGASMTVIDRGIADDLGATPQRSITAVSTTGAVQTEEIVLHDLHAGRWTLTRTTALTMPLPPFRNHGRLDGLLGMNAFVGHALLFDFRRRCLDVDAPQPRGVALPARTIAGRVVVAADGLNLVLDSGASFPVLMSARARALAMASGDAEITSAAGTLRAGTGVIPSLRIAGRTFRDLAVAFAQPRDEREDATVPLTLFERVYISAGRDAVIVEP